MSAAFGLYSCLLLSLASTATAVLLLPLLLLLLVGYAWSLECEVREAFAPGGPTSLTGQWHTYRSHACRTTQNARIASGRTGIRARPVSARYSHTWHIPYKYALPRHQVPACTMHSSRTEQQHEYWGVLRARSFSVSATPEEPLRRPTSAATVHDILRSIYIYIQVYIYQVLLYICTSSGSAPLRRVMRAKRMKKAILLVLESTAEQEQEREQARSNQTMHNSDRDELSHELRCSLAPCVPSRPPKTMPAKGVCEAALTEYVLSTPHWLLRTATLL